MPSPPSYDRAPETEPLLPGKASRRPSGSVNQWTLTALITIVAVGTTIAICALVFPLSSCKEHRRYLDERQNREEEERQRLNMFWTDPQSHTCASYGTRWYTARLVNVPENYDSRVEACMAMPIQVHGVEYKAKWCEDRGPNNIIGHWEVNQHEPECAPYWNFYKDFGCVSPGSGQRRIEHHLESLPQGGDWREFCATTPASFLGMHFVGAHLCFKKNSDTYGHWVFDDESCN